MSIIKDGKTYRTIEEQVYYLTKKQAKDEVDIESLRNDKQNKLTQSSVDDGTLYKAIGFDIDGNLVKGNVSADYDDLIHKPIINQIKIQNEKAFELNDVIVNGNKIHFDITKSTEMTNFLTNLTYSEDDGVAETLITGDDFTVQAFNLTAMSVGYIIFVVDERNSGTPTILYGTQSGDLSGLEWNEGFNNLDDDGNYTFELSNDNNVLHLSSASGWNGTLISELSEYYTPTAENGNYYRKDGLLYYYNNNEYKQILAEGDLSYDATVIEDSTNAVQGGAVYDALADKQDVITGSNVELNGVSNGVLGIDANGDLSKANLSDFLTTSSFPYSSNAMSTVFGYDDNNDLCSGNKIAPGFINPGNGNTGKVLKVISLVDPYAEWDNIEGEEIKSTNAASGNVLMANGSGGASWQNAGSTLYRHRIRGGTVGGTWFIYFEVINKISTAYTSSTIQNSIGSGWAVNACGYYNNNIILYVSNEGGIAYVNGFDKTNMSVYKAQLSTFSFSDTVITL